MADDQKKIVPIDYTHREFSSIPTGFNGVGRKALSRYVSRF